MKFFKKPAARISLAMMAFTVSLLLIADFIGLAPQSEEVAFAARKDLCESLAVQFSVVASKGDFATIKTTLHTLVQRNNDILSAALRSAQGEVLALAGDHRDKWHPQGDGHSTLAQIEVPILQNNKPWGRLELRFAPLRGEGVAAMHNSFWGLVAFVAVAGFFGYFFMMRRTLRELDPSAVVPARVNAAFDVLKEGVLILDEREQIVMANGAFAAHFGKKRRDLLGVKGSELGWFGYSSAQKKNSLPWLQVLASGKPCIGMALVLAPAAGRQIKFMVNAAPVLDGQGRSRGVLVTFDDVTELEEKNIRLNQAVNELQVSSEEIAAKNEELEFLASHDPMTKLLNRRSFNERLRQLFAQAQQEGTELSCIMCDIDHFKMVNDTYGHATGDEVIKAVAKVLLVKSREIDLVGRYGGEEFCLVFAGLDLGQAAAIGERIRETIAEQAIADIKITISLGVSSLAQLAKEPAALIKQADQGLYQAKETGRNKVVCWHERQDGA